MIVGFVREPNEDPAALGMEFEAVDKTNTTIDLDEFAPICDAMKSASSRPVSKLRGATRGSRARLIHRCLCRFARGQRSAAGARQPLCADEENRESESNRVRHPGQSRELSAVDHGN